MAAVEIVVAILGSFGGAAAVVALLAHFLGNIWTKRITAIVHARLEQELEAVKSKNEIALERFSRSAEAKLKDTEIFGGISKEVYQDFFKQRVDTYSKFLCVKNRYIEGMHEDFVTEEIDGWGGVYFSSYKSLRKLVIANQLYISTELDNRFNDLRLKAAQHINDADKIEAYAAVTEETLIAVLEKQDPVYEKFLEDTLPLMEKVLDQISADVKSLRSRIDLDQI